MSVGIYCNLRKLYGRCIYFICDTTLICNKISPDSIFPTNQRLTYFIKPSIRLEVLLKMNECLLDMTINKMCKNYGV
jgi:hypothetical protein